jgi:glycosyltransferase involved in cell wall biosynthesis
VVYTSIFSPADGRKNWRDMLSAFITALHDKPDATLVFKLATNPQEADYWLNDVVHEYRKLRISSRAKCKVIVATSYLSNAQMFDLARATTFYMNASKAEGSCLPLQDYLAAGRPALAPPHTGMADSLDAEGSFLIASSDEPTCWPQDPEWKTTTIWQRMSWQSLYEQIQTSYRMAKERPAEWHTMSAAARQKMKDLVDPESVWPLLKRALDEAVSRKSGVRKAA